MVRAALHLVPYALVAAASPLGLAATVTVMRTGRLKALGFAAGVVVGQLFACGVIVLLDAAVTPGHQTEHPIFEAVLELGLGSVLLVLAVIVRRRPASTNRHPSARSRAILDRLERVGVATAAAGGFLLGVGGPKRLVLTALASAAIIGSGVESGQELVLVVWYGVLATVVVWAPVLSYVLLGERAVAQVDGGFAWLSRHRRTVTFWALLVVGVALVADGLVLL